MFCPTVREDNPRAKYGQTTVLLFCTPPLISVGFAHYETFMQQLALPGKVV